MGGIIGDDLYGHEPFCRDLLTRGFEFILVSVSPIRTRCYLLHTRLEWTNDKYRLLRQKLPSRQRLFNDMRANVASGDVLI